MDVFNVGNPFLLNKWYTYFDTEALLLDLDLYSSNRLISYKMHHERNNIRKCKKVFFVYGVCNFTSHPLCESMIDFINLIKVLTTK